jgi:4-amino-4-deoxy-L-arabinose transferase-like glycosyltransferase
MSINARYLNFRCRISLLFLVCLLLRLCFSGKYLDSCDSIDFALGLRDYDLSLLQPHFPGYPVYIFISGLFFKLLHNDVWALALPGVLFGSLSVYPLSFLARRLFSEKVATLTAMLYLINPLCWLQAERPTSDALGFFFIMLSAHYLYQALTSHARTIHAVPGEAHCNTAIRKAIQKKFRVPKVLIRSFAPRVWCGDRNLFLGSLALGVGLGVRLSYSPFLVLWIATVFAVRKRPCRIAALVWRLRGLAVGVCLWFLPQIGYTGWCAFFQNGFSFSRGHFTDWGGSVFTSYGLERAASFIKSVWVFGLGGWWYDTSCLRLVPSLIIAISFFCFFRYYPFDRRGWFLGVYGVPYLLWVILGQNVANPRHLLPLMPMLCMMIAYGLCKACERGCKGVSLVFILSLTLCMAVTSLKVVIKYHHDVPAPIQLIRFLERHSNPISSRIYCSNEERFFDYYVPQWDVRTVRNRTELQRDVLSSLETPQQILIVHSPGEIEQFGVTRLPTATFQGNPYADSAREGLLLYTLTEW